VQTTARQLHLAGPLLPLVILDPQLPLPHPTLMPPALVRCVVHVVGLAVAELRWIPVGLLRRGGQHSTGCMSDRDGG